MMQRVRNAHKAGGFGGIARAVIRKLGYRNLDRHTVDEVSICATALEIQMRPGVMVDVGAHHGGSARAFCRAGWQVFAFEPDSDNRERLTRNLGHFGNLKIDARALSNEEKDSVTFYQSSQSSGISGLSRFHETHVAAGAVSVTTLKNAIEEYRIDHIDFLKIDAEGFDKFVLMGLPWETCSPTLVVCEFEDLKTRPLGYDFNDLVGYLEDKGYQVLVSEWKPIVAYGAEHEWSSFERSPCKLSSERCWGNLIATRDSAVFERVIDECDRVRRRLGKA